METRLRSNATDSGIRTAAGTRSQHGRTVAMIATGSKTSKVKHRGKQTGKQGGKTDQPPVKPLDEELYESGDMATPERDRDDEQHDL
jgi:hypothetical protein